MSDYSHPDRCCDLVMKGGITSGIRSVTPAPDIRRLHTPAHGRHLRCPCLRA